MKISKWFRRIGATLIAAGMLSPAAAQAAALNVNLVVNGDFENVDLATTGDYNSPLILGWTGPSLFAYSHNGSSTSAGVVPDYAEGADPPAAGNWYFTPNNAGLALIAVHDPGVYYQDIDVSSGPTATAIASGNASYSLAAWMTSYLNDTDYGNVLVEFRDAGAAVLGSGIISDTADAGPNNVWNLTSTTGAVPIGTASIRMSLYGVRTAGGAGADGYTDNIDFRIVPEPTSAGLAALGLAALGLRRRDRKDS